MSAVHTGENLTALINKSKSSCLNENVQHPWMNLLGGGGSILSLRSDADEQLLLTLALNTTVKLTSVVIGLPSNDSCPRTIRLYLNNENMGFDDASELKPIQEIQIPSSGLSEFCINLQALKWQRTDSISIFVQDNHGADYSSLTSIGLYGATINGTDVSKIKGC